MARRRSPRRIRIGVRIGELVRGSREARGWTKTMLSERSGISRQMIAAVESAEANPCLDVLGSLFDGLEIDVDLVAHGQTHLDRPRGRDAAHAICTAYVQRRLEAAGWKVAREVRIEDGRYLGWIDLLAFDPATSTLLVIEIKTQIDDVGGIERSIAWLLALATDDVDEELRRNRTIWTAAFPMRAPEMAVAMLVPTGQVVGRGLALIDPRSRRRDWLIRARADGRRSDAPYRGYADFMAQVRRRRG
jgi:transcriptional regulator with XRE-family HTH domain